MIIKTYKDEYGNEPFIDWLESIKDKAIQVRIRSRLMRIERGSLGDHRSIGEGLHVVTRRSPLHPGGRGSDRMTHDCPG